MRDLKAFIFDMDGTLVDSKLDFDAMREELKFPKGAPLLEHIEYLGDSITDEERARFFSIINKHELRGARESELMPGCVEFLQFLKRNNIKTAVLTRNSLDVTQKTFKKWNLSFDIILTRDCVIKPKPDPEGLITICKTLEIHNEEAVYIGDFLFDLQTAHNAQMKAILYSQEPNNELEAHADLVVSSYPTLVENFNLNFLSPLGFKSLSIIA